MLVLFLFLAFSDLTCHLGDTGICFQVALCVPTVISGGVDIFEVPGSHLF